MRVFPIKKLVARLASAGRAAPSSTQQAGIQLSVNDPRWGHRPTDPKSQEGRRPNNNPNNNNDGPPDLDQLWRDFNQRLNRIFGNKRGDGGGPFRPGPRSVGLGVTVIGAVAVLIWLASGAYIVQDGQVGIVTTFGKLSHTTGAGFNWHWPAPFQALETVDTAQVQSVDVGYRANVRNKQPNEALMLTNDQNIVDVQFSVQFKIKDAVAWAFNNRDQVDTVRDAAETVMRELVARNTMDATLRASRDTLAQQARADIQRITDRYRLGAEIAGVTVQSVAPPDQIASAYDDAGKADEERQRARADAQAYADDIIPQAKGRAARMLQDAEGYRATVENVAAGNVARFDKIVAEYAKAPAVTRDRMYLDTMQQILSSTSKVMIDTKNGTNQLYLPLDRLLAQSTANEAARGAGSGPVMVPAPAPAPNAQGAPAQPGQPVPLPAPQVQAAPQPTTAQPAQPDPLQNGESQRTRELRSRDTGRERESR